MTHRIVFLGTPDFAVQSLQSLVADDRFEIVLVVSQPDRRAGRGRKLTQPPVAACATSHSLDLFQPPSLREESAIARIEDLAPDLLVVVAYGEILNRRVLSLAPHGAINVHPSLLPKYRGAAPIPAAILNGDTESGVSIMKLVRKLDAGPVIHQVRHGVNPEDTTATLGERLASLAREMLPDVAHGWITGELQAVPQIDTVATYTREWSKDGARIDWTRPAVEIERLVRASLPWPVAWTEVDGERMQIREVAVDSENTNTTAPAGTVERHGDRAIVATGSGSLELLIVQPASKRPVAGSDWIRNTGRDVIIFT